jgi:hypothetical protein
MSAMIVAAFFATPTWAAWNGDALRQGAASTPDTKAPKPSNYSDTLTIIEQVGSGSGPCTGGEGWADYCPSGDCSCFTYTGSVKGTDGSGEVTIYETFDNLGSLFGIGNSNACTPAIGDIEISGSKNVESFAFSGADCEDSVTRVTFLNGECMLEDTNVFEGGLVAKCGGNYSTSTKNKFTISGKALK